MKKKVIVVGSTGVVGAQLINQLSSRDDISKIVSITRRPIVYNCSKVINEVINFDEIDKYQELLHGDALFSCLGTTLKLAGTIEKQRLVDVEHQYHLAKMAASNGVSQYLLVSSSGADATSSNAYLKMKGQLEGLVIKLEFESIAIFQPSLLLGTRADFRIAEVLGKYILPVLCLLPVLSKYKPITGEAVAKKMIAVAMNNNKGIGYYRLDDISQ
jgi:uncharacterized protein YbjT (DUF2867 family)